MKKTIIKVLSAVLSLLFIIGCFGVYHFYGDEIVETINGWLQIDNEQQNTNYNKLQSLIVQMDSNNSEIVELEKKIEENQLLIEEKLLIADAENLTEIEKLKALNEVFKNRVIELESKNKELETSIEELKNQMAISQTELEKLHAQISNSGVELIVSNFTGTVDYYSLPDEKNFSDYSVLYFIAMRFDTEKYVSMAIPYEVFRMGYMFEFALSSADEDRYLQFSYVNDTSYFIGSNEWVEFRYIYGLKRMDK